MPLRSPLTGIRRPTGVPCLVVDDLPTALRYYRDSLGWHMYGYQPDFAPGRSVALVRGHGVTLALRQTGPDDATEPAAGPHAVVLVHVPRRVRYRLDDRGAHLQGLDGLGPNWTDSFGVTDNCGNLIAIGPLPGRVAALDRLVTGPLDDLARRYSERRRARAEAPHLAAFRAFYNGLASKRDIVYLFFSGRLLHWVVKAASYVPADVNLVLLGSDLPADEVAWLREHVDRPFHHVELRIDDQIAWEFLFTVNRHSFGWLDSDCLVLDDRVWSALTDLDPRTSMNCVWSWDSGYGFPLANTFLLFVNVAAIRAVRAANLGASPYSYDYDWQNLQVPGRRCYSRRPARRHLDALRGLVPLDPDSGRPATPHGMPYFDTMVMFQLLARSRGYPINRVRELEAFGHLRGRPVQDESSDELLHVGGVSKADPLAGFTGFFHDPATRLRYLIAESVVLAEVADRLPEYYRDRRERVTAALAEQGLSPTAAVELIRAEMVEQRGMSLRGVDAVLGRRVEAELR